MCLSPDRQPVLAFAVTTCGSRAFANGCLIMRLDDLSRHEPRTTTPDMGLTRRWTINGDFLALQPTGVARYAREVTLALDRLVAEHDPLTAGLDLDLVAPRALDGFAPAAIPIRVVPDARRLRLPQAWVQARLPWHVPGGLLSFCNLAPVAIRRHIVCIHDLQTRTMPQSYGLGFRLVHRVVLPALGRRAAVITTVSGHSRDELVRYGIASAEKIAVTCNGADHARGWRADRSTRAFPSGPFVLCLGRPQPYKNSALMCRLAEPLAAVGIAVVMAGDITADDLARPGQVLPANLQLIGRISDDDLARGLSQALCFAFPSRSEGFGLPAVEAMMMGCPVVAADAPALPEICGEAALFASPDDVAGWVAAIVSLRDDPQLRARLVERGRERAMQTYSWRAIARSYLRLMARVDAGGPIACAHDAA